MSGTGLQELLECVYASNAVGHMLSGKAVARAIRGHLLVSGTLNAMLVSHAFDVPLSLLGCQEDDEQATADAVGLTGDGDSGDQDSDFIPDLLSSAGALFDDLLAGLISPDSLQNSEIVQQVRQKMNSSRVILEARPTAKLWLQYLDMVKLLQTFIKAERSGNWQLHLRTMQDMLPYLAATGHNNYTKSVQLYLQDMYSLEEKHPQVYQHFQQGLHVIRRSDRYWAGLPPDLVIEQVLMRSIKTTGGLTRGRGMTETQRLVWLLSNTACAEVNIAMQELTSVSYISSEQHKDMSTTRQAKDMSDAQAMLSFLSSRNPFHEHDSLHCIVTGVVADVSVNAGSAKEVGDKILSGMTGKTISKHSFRKKDQVVTMSHSTAIRIRDEDVQIDPQLLFQRLVTAGMRLENMHTVFQYELCSYPPSLFENRYSPRQTQKSTLADAMWKLIPPEAPEPAERTMKYVLDGGALLHRIPWQCGVTYEEICQQYSRYVGRHYGQPTIVFDGYLDGPTTKDIAHQRRAGGCIGATVELSSSMVFRGKKEHFLSNNENKQKFIALLSHHLQHNGCHTKQSKSDADLLIVQTTVEEAARSTTTPTLLVGDDTDLLILLCYHAPLTAKNIYFRPQPRHGSHKAPRCWNIAVLKEILGPEVCRSILFVHAILGCDTTSHMYGLGKATALKLARTSPLFREHAQVFTSPESSRCDITTAGAAAIVALYNGQVGDELDALRLLRFYQKVGSSTACVQPRVLPPTSGAAKFHSMRVYLQVQQWMGAHQMNPEDWGWKIQGGRYMAVLTDKDPAPSELLEVVRCNCKTGCGTRLCSCRKHGLDCSTGCGQCRGICTNSSCSDGEEEDRFGTQ